MPKYPYKAMGTSLDRNFRNDYNQNLVDIEQDIKNVKTEVSEKAFQEVVDSAKLNWKEPVASQNNLPGGASQGDTRQVRDTGKVYRFNGSAWVEIQQIDAGPYNELDSRLTSQLAQTANQNDLQNGLDSKVDKNGNEQITMGMLSQEIKESMTGGSVAVVGNDAVNTSNIVDKAATSQKRTVLGERGHLVGSQPLKFVINDNEKTLTFPVVYSIVSRKGYYSIPANTVVDLTQNMSTYSRGFVFYDTNTQQFIVCREGNIASLINENCIFLGGFNNSGNVSFACDYTLNGASVTLKTKSVITSMVDDNAITETKRTNSGEIGTIVSSTKPPDFVTYVQDGIQKRKLVFASSTYLYNRRNSYQIQTGLELDLSIGTDTTSLAVIYFDTISRNLTIYSRSMMFNAPQSSILIGTYNPNGQEAYLFGDFTVNGKRPYEKEPIPAEVSESTSYFKANDFKTIDAFSDIYTLDFIVGNKFKITNTTITDKDLKIKNAPNNEYVAVHLLIKFDKAARFYLAGTVWRDGIAPVFLKGEEHHLLFESYDGGITWIGNHSKRQEVMPSVIKKVDINENHKVKELAYTNKVLNSSFEDDLKNWTIGGSSAATKEISTAQAKNGVKSLKIAMSGNNARVEQKIAFPEGHLIFVTFDVLSEIVDPTAVYGYVYDYNNVGALAGINGSTQIKRTGTDAGIWERIGNIYEATSGGIIIKLGRTSTATATTYYDCVMAIDLTELGLENQDFRYTDLFPWMEYGQQGIVKLGASKPPVITLYSLNDQHLIRGADGDKSRIEGDGTYGTRYYYAQQSHLKKFVEIVNNVQPDAVLHLGDMVDNKVEQDYDFFISQWDRIQVPKYVQLGNHDTWALNDINDYNSFVERMGYHTRPLNALSPFNQSFVVSSKDGKFKIRIIMFETQLDDEGNHFNSTQGSISTKTINWIQQELEQSLEKNVILASHHGAYMPIALDMTSKTAFVNAVNTALSRNTGLKILAWIFGHYHVNNVNYFSFDNIPAYNVACSLNSIEGRYTVINIDEDYNISFDVGATVYPY